MKPQEALDLLDRTVAQMNGPRLAHVQFQQAIECLKRAISPTGNHDAGRDKDSSDKDVGEESQ